MGFFSSSRRVVDVILFVCCKCRTSTISPELSSSSFVSVVIIVLVAIFDFCIFSSALRSALQRCVAALSYVWVCDFGFVLAPVLSLCLCVRSACPSTAGCVTFAASSTADYVMFGSSSTAECVTFAWSSTACLCPPEILLAGTSRFCLVAFFVCA